MRHVESTHRKSLIWLWGGFTAGALLTTAGAILVAAWLGGSSPGETAGPPLFEDVTDVAGLSQVYDGDFHFFVGGGLAVFDCNSDHLPDIYVAGGVNTAGLYVNHSRVGGGIVFEQASSRDGGLANATGAYPIDIDSDGLIDLAVLRVGENVVLRGQGDCQFERANEQWGIDGGDDWTVAFSARWVGGDALPHLAFGNYLRLKESGERDECENHVLFRPDGDSYSTPQVLSPGFCTLSILFSDWNRTGTADLRVTNDRHYYTDGQEQLWNMGEPSPEPYSAEEGWQMLKIWGMGIASHDLDRDGLPEVFLTSQGDNKLQTLGSGAQQPMYEDIALAVGATAHRPFAGDTLSPSTAWHAEFDDLNNDGLMDLFVTKGNVEAQIDFAAEDPNNLLLGGHDGIFTETADVAGLLDYARSRGASVTDLNLDGLLDVVVVERRERVKVWQNTGSSAAGGAPPGNWLMLDLKQPTPNRDAVGSWIEVDIGGHTVTREIIVGGGHASGELGWVHFGLGTAEEAKVRVVWPDGDVSRWESVPANELVVWDRDSGVTSWSPSED